jgi:hypothetical protein
MSAPRVSLDRARLDRLRQGAVVVRSEPSAFSVTGMGALQCLQGLLTNDLVKPGDHSLYTRAAHAEGYDRPWISG